jgi:hypothetical protein
MRQWLRRHQFNVTGYFPSRAAWESLEIVWTDGILLELDA